MIPGRMYLVLIILLSLTIAAAFPTTHSSQAVSLGAPTLQTPFFQDNFNGSSIDSTKWNSTFATSGLRWCPSTVANHEDAAGTWLNPSLTTCQGVNQSTPFGSVSVGGGAATFSSFASHAFPYIWNGAPSKSSPFPPIGNFVLEVKMRYNSVTGSGDGFFVNRWNDSDPVGNNPPGGHPRILLIWADSTGLNVQLLGNQTYSVYNELGTHDFVLEYIDGQYSVFVDGFRALGPVGSSARANAIWVGNPVFTWWAPFTGYDWSSFSLSEVRVGLPLIQVSPTTGPIGTKVLVQGQGIPVQSVEITFDDDFIGTTPVSNNTFSFTLDVPQAQQGSHQIKAVDQFGGAIASAQFIVSPTLPTSLGLSFAVGSIYFPGDTVVATILVTSSGMPVSSPTLQLRLNLTKPDNSNFSLNLTSIGSGLFKASYLLPRSAQIGTYALEAAANSATLGSGSNIATFEVKLPWLSSQGSTLAVAGVVSVAVLAVGLVSWRKGSFKRPRFDTNWNE